MGNSLVTLPEWIGELTELTELNIRWNGLSTLPNSIGNLVNLQKP